MKSKLFLRFMVCAILAAFASMTVLGQTRKAKQMALYVSNAGANTITKYDAETGAFLGVVVQGGSELQGANGFDFAPDGSIYVAGEYSNNIVHYSRKGRLIEVLDAANLAGIEGPQGVSFGPDGLLYVSSMGNDKIVRFDVLKKAYKDKFCDVSVPNVEHAGPINVDFGPDGHLYVGTFMGHKQLKYQGPAAKTTTGTTAAAATVAPGTLLAIFDDPPCTACTVAKKGAGGDVKLKGGATIRRVNLLATEVVQSLSYASGDFYDDGDPATAPVLGAASTATNDPHYFVDVFDSNTFTGRVVEFTKDGQYVRTFVPENTNGLILPGGIAFSPDGSFYVANVVLDENFNDAGSVIMRFDARTGAPLGTFVGQGNGLSIPFAMRFGKK